jgi:hypothetical protein
MGWEARTVIASAPPTASAHQSESRRNRGTNPPYSGRGVTDSRTVASPPVQATLRRIEPWDPTRVGRFGSSGATGMQSVISTVPRSQTNVVTSTLVSSR